MRPANCRERLREEGKAYPKSSCQECGTVLRAGFTCPYREGAEDLFKEALEDEKSHRRFLQEECDKLLDRLLEKRQQIKTINMEINRLKRVIRENSQKDEGRGS